PRPRGQRLQDPLSPPPSLRDSIAWQTLRLSLAQLERKLAALRAHHSQFVSSSGYLLSFVRPNELFGDLPEVSTEAVDTREAPAAKPDRLTAAERAAFIGMT
ncbi:MAG: hypothetical protein N3A53_06425, partial [Verrucomicrobiae bacterium]|nr:hypothetical protein [Verrucomicrobiae bacterium]